MKPVYRFRLVAPGWYNAKDGYEHIVEVSYAQGGVGGPVKDVDEAIERFFSSVDRWRKDHGHLPSPTPHNTNFYSHDRSFTKAHLFAFTEAQAVTYDRDALDNLGASIGTVGQLQSVAVCKQHPDRVLSGKHRMKKGAAVTAQVDVDAKAKELGVPHQTAETLLQMHFNVQRQIGRDERRDELRTMALQLDAQGTPKAQIAKKIIELTRGVVGRSWVYELVDEEFKNPVRVQASREAKKVDIGAEPPKTVPYRKGLSELASQHVEKTATPAKVRLLEIVNRAVGPHFRDEERFDRKKVARDGTKMFYSVDVALDNGVGLEAEGEGTSSDDPVRERFILEHPSVGGLEVRRLVHLPNDLILKYPNFVEEYIALLYRSDHPVWKKRNG